MCSWRSSSDTPRPRSVRCSAPTTASPGKCRPMPRPRSSFQLVQAMLAEIQTGVYAGRAMALQAARDYDSAADRRIGPSAAKLYCSEMVDRAADLAVQIHGGMGY